MSFTTSTTGITQNPRSAAVAYSLSPTAVKSNAEARTGISHTAVVRARLTIAAMLSILFMPFILNKLFSLERRLKLWNISAMERVRNAIVVP